MICPTETAYPDCLTWASFRRSWAGSVMVNGVYRSSGRWSASSCSSRSANASSTRPVPVACMGQRSPALPLVGWVAHARITST